ncbi:hypothetical protein Pint_27057 [Pistacia integerrima]|uniref:Uncharacterized protein n=1 Tax=Pistacia integerrima TaxID=434235 RepID=A0ACC0YPH5_9ROSI|nr:hypothetical protein Pint_27057 [Pistacia integerrima]
MPSIPLQNPTGYLVFYQNNAKGLKVEGLDTGSLKNLNLMEWDKLCTINKKIIYPVCPRHIVPIEERRVLLILINGPAEPFVHIIPSHKKYDGSREKATTYTRRIWIDQADAISILLAEGEDFLDVLNPWTKIETPAIGDCNMRNLKHGEILQLERKDYYRCDVPFTRPSKPVVLFAIPDGHQQTVLK